MGKLIISIFITAAFFLGGCINVDEDKIAEECQLMLDEERPKIVEDIRQECALMLAVTLSECNSMCNDMMDEAITSVQDWCSSEVEQLLDNAESDLLTGFGCVEESSEFGWDCSEANICIGEGLM